MLKRIWIFVVCHRNQENVSKCQIFTNWSWVGKDKNIEAIARSSIQCKIHQNSELQCKALGPQNCLAIPIEDWQNEKQSIYDFILS